MTKRGSQRMTSCLTGSFGALMVVPWFLDACYAAVAEKVNKQNKQFV